MKRVALVAALLLTSCMPLYIPPVPSSETFLYNDVRVVHVEANSPDQFAVSVQGTGEFWLAAQWFTAGGKLLASHSVWVELAGNTVTTTMPNVAPEYSHIVFSANDVVLRVFHNEAGNS